MANTKANQSNSSGPTSGGSTQTTDGVNQDLLNAFVGNNYRKITTRVYNIPAFFFGGLYFMYRKMLWQGLVIIIVESFISSLISCIPNFENAAAVSLLVSIVINLVLCFTFNKLYLSYAEKRMAKIKSENPGANEEGLKTIYADSGSTSGGWVFGGICVLILISIISNLFFTAIGLKADPEDSSGTFQIETIQSNNNSNTPSNTFEGVFSYDNSVNIDQVYTLSIPDQFNDNSSVYRYNYVYAEDLQSPEKCTVTLSALKDFSNAEDLINQMVGYYSSSDPSADQTTQLADQTWYWFSRTSDTGEKYDYATNNDDKVYLLEYTIAENDEAPGCAEFRTQILDSLKKA